MARLMLAAKQQEVEIWRGRPATDLVVGNGRDTGVTAERRGETLRIAGRHGLPLVAGGYAHNDAVRKEFRDPASGDWSSVVPEDTSDMTLATNPAR